MRPIKLEVISAAAVLWLATTGNVNAQNLSINGNPCTFTSYTKTVTAAGTPTFAFTAPGCTTGGSPTPTAGTMQFSSPTYPDLNVAATGQVTVTNSGRITGGGNDLSGTVASSTPTICTVPPSSTVAFNDSNTVAKQVTVTAVAEGTCTLTLTGAGVGSPASATLAVTNPASPGVVGFQLASSTATAGGANAQLVVARTGAGSSSLQATVNFTCNQTGLSATPSVSPPGTLTFAAGGSSTQNISVSIPALANSPTPGSISCNLAGGITGGITLGTDTHAITVTSTPAPVCSPTVSTTPGSLATGVGGTANFTANCTNAPTGYTWAAVTAGAPALTNGTTATPSATFGAAVAAGTYQYSVQATNGGGNSALATVNVTVGAAPSANCIEKIKATEYPSWVPTDNYLVAGMQVIQQGPTQTHAFRFAVDDLLNPGNTAGGSFQAYEASIGVGHVISVSTTPCGYSETPAFASCQSRPDTSGKPSLRYLHWNHPAGDADIVNGNYCRLPNPGSNNFLWVNVRFSQTGAPCTLTSCSYTPLYVKF